MSIPRLCEFVKVVCPLPERGKQAQPIIYTQIPTLHYLSLCSTCHIHGRGLFGTGNSRRSISTTVTEAARGNSIALDHRPLRVYNHITHGIQFVLSKQLVTLVQQTTTYE